MNVPKRPSGRPRRSASSTSGPARKSVKLHQSFGDRMRNRKFARSTRKAAYLSTLPKEPWKRLLYRLEPRRLAKYWFSREGGIMALKITGIGIVAGFLIVIGLFAYYRKDLPKIKDISGDKLGGSITYYDRTGKTVLWQDYDAVKRVPVTSDNQSKYVKQATVAIEDKDFYNHGAFDVRGIMRAGIHDIVGGGGGTQGGSTITQQLVKLNEQWTDNRTITRKVKELILAVELEREYSKDDILTAYLNVAPYGGVENGVEAASRDYFGVSAKDLTLPEATMLAAIPKAPSLYSPYGSTQFNPEAGNSFDKDLLKARMNYILDQMVNQHMIKADEAASAKKVDVLTFVHPLLPKYQGIKAPYFVLAAKQELENKYGSTTVKLGGWKVTTTLDLNMQNTAEQLVASNLPNVTRLTAGTADEEATVLEDVQTGQINALVGGTDFTNADHGQNNYAASIKIPPGSSFKPYDYTTLINNNNNVGAGSVLYDSQGALPGYACTNKNSPKTDDKANCLWDYDFKYPGAVTLRYALGGSRNVPAVKAMLEADPTDTSSTHVKSINKVISTASAMMDNPYHKGSTYNCYSDEQNTQTTQCYGASAIGDGAFLHLDDHVNGLSTLARLGSAIPKTYILQINDASGKNIYKWQQPKGKQVIKQDAAYIVDDMASDPNASYLPGSCTATNCTKLSSFGYKFHRDNGWHFAVKTGTTNNGFDGLMTSWSTKYAVVSWVGNHNRNVNIQAPRGAAMETLTEPMTRGLMEAAHAGKTPVNWTQPSDIKTAAAFVLNHKISSLGEIPPSPTNDLYPSWYTAGAKTNTSAVLDKVSGKLATSCTPALAKDSQTNGNAASWNIDIFSGGKANTGSTTTTSNKNGTQATDDVHNCNDPPPLVSVSVAGDNCDSSCTITVTASQQSGGHPLSGGSYTAAPAGTVTVQLAGQTICNLTIPASDSDVFSDSSCTYTPTTAQQAQLTAMVVDSVLYSGNGTSDTINFTPAAVNTPLTYAGSNHTGSPGNPKTVIKWNGGGGTVTVKQGSTILCTQSASNGQCTASGNIIGAVLISDDQGDSTSAIVT
jgi:membrane peptidoglycan carboxypeptidase